MMLVASVWMRYTDIFSYDIWILSKCHMIYMYNIWLLLLLWYSCDCWCACLCGKEFVCVHRLWFIHFVHRLQECNLIPECVVCRCTLYTTDLHIKYRRYNFSVNRWCVHDIQWTLPHTHTLAHMYNSFPHTPNFPANSNLFFVTISSSWTTTTL